MEAWMVLPEGIPEIVTVEVGINFRCSDAFMTQHFLNGS